MVRRRSVLLKLPFGIVVGAGVAAADDWPLPTMDRRQSRIVAPVSEQLYWDDLRFPVANLTTPAAGRPDSETGTGMQLFDAAATETLFGLAQMPHGWKEGSAIRPHLHWTPTTAGGGNVLWRLEYQIRDAEDAAAFDFSTGWTTANLLAAAGTTAHKPLISSFGDVAMTGFHISALIHFKISRVGGDGTDTYAADARLLELDFHYQQDSPGSHGVFLK